MNKIKKTPLASTSIFIPYGYEYREDLPEFHIEGVVCTEAEYNANLAVAISRTREYINSKVLAKRAINKQLPINKLLERI